MRKENYNFALIGAAGYIAPRHMQAIKDTDNQLIAALDKFDSVGIIDSFFPNADFFTETERFDRHLDKLRRKGEHKIDYVSICSPNYLHDSHIRLSLRNDAHAICEKPLVLNPWNVEALKELEVETQKKIYTVLQLRHHPSIIALKEKIEKNPDKIYDIDLTYITGRGNWYAFSWKGEASKSGGIATNIGIHFFDMLTWIFGKTVKQTVHLNQENKAAGFMQLEKANVRWFLSIDAEDLPEEIKKKQQRTYRSILVQEEEIEFSGGFTDLHTVTYQEILKGKGYGLDAAKNSINTVYEIRNAKTQALTNEYHPFIKKIK
jgi:UDP-N-acetyl-2-amino-2-deoxyglucuronate dehydrogenase